MKFRMYVEHVDDLWGAVEEEYRRAEIWHRDHNKEAFLVLSDALEEAGQVKVAEVIRRLVRDNLLPSNMKYGPSAAVWGSEGSSHDWPRKLPLMTIRQLRPLADWVREDENGNPVVHFRSLRGAIESLARVGL